MKTVIPFLFAVVSILNINQTAKADELPPMGSNDERIAMQAAISARNEFLRALLKRDYIDLARAGMDQAVKDLTQQLREQNDAESADAILNQWGDDGGISQFEMAFSMNVGADLGDHAPLIQWLEVKLVKLEEKYGALISKLPIIKTIRTVNFALPVVFTPASKKWSLAGQDNRIEYRKHFIPFANLITYYGSLYACNLIAAKSQQPQLKKLCKKAASKLEFVMGRYLAPKLSDFIYKVANRKKVAEPAFNRDQLRYTQGDDLSYDIRGLKMN